MAVKCVHNNYGFCKFGEDCRFGHPSQVCRETSCQTRGCAKRHPRPCKNHFLKKHCKFGQDCKYDHIFDCEICENMKYLVEKEAKHNEESLRKKDDVIQKMMKEIQNLKKDKDVLEKQVNSSHQENMKLHVEMKKVNEKYSKLEDVSKACKAEIKTLEKAAKASKKEFEDTKDSNQKIKEIKQVNMKILEENYLLKANLENIKPSEREKLDEYERKIKIKEKEIESLKITRKLSVDHVVKLEQINQQLEKEVEDLKRNKVLSKVTELPYPCDKCDSTFKTAGLLVRHVKEKHGNQPVLKALVIPPLPVVICRRK